MGLNPAVATRRARIAAIAVLALTLLYSFLLSAVAGLITLPTLTATIPGLGKALDGAPVLASFLTGFVPTLAVILVVAIVPMILTALAHYGGARSGTAATSQILTNFYTFNVWNVFLIFTVAGTILTSVDQIVASPTAVVGLLARSLPSLASFFMVREELGGLEMRCGMDGGALFGGGSANRLLSG